MLMAQLSAYNQAGVRPPEGKEASTPIEESSSLVAGSKTAVVNPPKGLSTLTPRHMYMPEPAE